MRNFIFIFFIGEVLNALTVTTKIEKYKPVVIIHGLKESTKQLQFMKETIEKVS